MNDERRESWQYFEVLFTREYGFWKFRSCTLTARMLVNTNEASLACEWGVNERANTTWDLSVETRTRLGELVRAADLFGADHVGTDRTPMDGIFELLRLRLAEDGRSAALVVSGNRSFVEHQARRDLVHLLNQIMSELSDTLPRPEIP